MKTMVWIVNLFLSFAYMCGNDTLMPTIHFVFFFSSTGQILLQYYNSSLEIDGDSNKIVKFGAVASIGGGSEANYNNEAPKVVYYSARGPDPEDSLPHEADIMKPNLVAPGNLIWAAWSSVASDSVEFLGLSIHKQIYLENNTMNRSKVFILSVPT